MSPSVVVGPNLTQARAALIDARDAFEAAVRLLESAEGETVMASDELLILLDRMAAARSYLAEIDRNVRRRGPSPAAA